MSLFPVRFHRTRDQARAQVQPKAQDVSWRYSLLGLERSPRSGTVNARAGSKVESNKGVSFPVRLLLLV
jgi:hypothetical protein